MIRVLVVAAGVVVAAVVIDVAVFLAAVEHFDGDYDFGF